MDLRQRRLTGIEQVFNGKQSEIRRKRNELKSLAEQLGTGDPEALSIRQQLLVQELGTIRRQIIEVQARGWNVDMQLRALSSVAPRGEAEASLEAVAPTDADIESALLRDPVYYELVRDKIATFRMQAEAESAFKTPPKSPYKSVQDRIESEMRERREQIKDELAAFAPMRQKGTDSAGRERT